MNINPYTSREGYNFLPYDLISFLKELYGMGGSSSRMTGDQIRKINNAENPTNPLATDRSFDISA